MINSRTLLAALALAASPLAAHAQTCLGLAPFSAGTKQVAGSAGFTSDAHAFTGTLTFGSIARAFVGLSGGTISYEAFDGNTTTVGVSLGLQIPISTGARVQLCPGLGVLWGFGPDNISGFGTDLSSRAEFFGLQVGISVGDGPTYRFVPTVGAAVAHSKIDFEGGMFSGEDEPEVYGVITVGVGLVKSSWLSIQPGVDFTFCPPRALSGGGARCVGVGLSDEPTYTVVLALNFGRRRR